MIQSFFSIFGTTIYVQIWENRLKVVDLKSGLAFDEKPLVAIEKLENGKKKVVAIGNQATERIGSSIVLANPFSHPRVLFSDFPVGEKLLRGILDDLLGKGFLRPKPKMVIHPMEKNEGGLTMIEKRAFRELAASAGASDVKVYEGPEIYPLQIDFSSINDISYRGEPRKQAGRNGRMTFVLIFYAVIFLVLIMYGS